MYIKDDILWCGWKRLVEKVNCVLNRQKIECHVALWTFLYICLCTCSTTHKIFLHAHCLLEKYRWCFERNHPCPHDYYSNSLFKELKRHIYLSSRTRWTKVNLKGKSDVLYIYRGEIEIPSNWNLYDAKYLGNKFGESPKVF